MFDFFEIVTVLECDKNPELVHQLGYVAGKSYDEEDEQGDPVEGSAVSGYAVLLFRPEQVCFFLTREIKSTGYFIATRIDDRGNVVPVGVDKA